MPKTRQQVIIGATSAAGYHDRRQACLETWAGGDSRYDVDVVFLVGDSRHPLPKREGPILHCPCPDSYAIYAYDGLNRVTDMQRGLLDLHASPLTLHDLAFAQAWDLDKAGNWRTFRQDSQGDGAWDLVQPRVANNGNELVAIGASAGPLWFQPAYDPAGNMVAFPQPEALQAGFTGVYDAWNRLVKVLAGTEVVPEYAYDGRSFRVKKTLGEDEWHLYYTSDWRLIETRLATPTPADLRCQYVWGLGINDLILRDRDTDRDGVVDERLYALQDSHWDMCAVVGTDGAVVERYEYEAYGWPRVLDPAFNGRAGSVCGWTVLYSGHLFDAETGLYCMRYRFYHPALGVWITRDPLFDYWGKGPIGYDAIHKHGVLARDPGTCDSLRECNMYSFVMQTPLDGVDPLGAMVLHTPKALDDAEERLTCGCPTNPERFTCTIGVVVTQSVSGCPQKAGWTLVGIDWSREDTSQPLYKFDCVPETFTDGGTSLSRCVPQLTQFDFSLTGACYYRTAVGTVLFVTTEKPTNAGPVNWGDVTWSCIGDQGTRSRGWSHKMR